MCVSVVAEAWARSLDESMIVPLSGRSIPERRLSNVLLPEPEGPINATRSPGWIEKLTSFKIICLPYALQTCSTCKRLGCAFLISMFSATVSEFMINPRVYPHERMLNLHSRFCRLMGSTEEKASNWIDANGLAFYFVLGCLAQSVEQLTLNQQVEGSSPSASTNIYKKRRKNDRF